MKDKPSSTPVEERQINNPPLHISEQAARRLALWLNEFAPRVISPDDHEFLLTWAQLFRLHGEMQTARYVLYGYTDGLEALENSLRS